MIIEVKESKVDLTTREIELVLNASIKVEELSTERYGRDPVFEKIQGKVADALAEKILNSAMSSDIMAKVDIEFIVKRIQMHVISGLTGQERR